MHPFHQASQRPSGRVAQDMGAPSVCRLYGDGRAAGGGQLRHQTEHATGRRSTLTDRRSRRRPRPDQLLRHMRQHREGGRSNQREIDVIAEEVIPKYCRGFASTDIGVTTPYRHQVTKAAHVLDQTEADTVHKFQGRQKQVVILTMVLDETWRGRTGPAFVDDPQLINAASRGRSSGSSW